MRGCRWKVGASSSPCGARAAPAAATPAPPPSSWPPPGSATRCPSLGGGHGVTQALGEPRATLGVPRVPPTVKDDVVGVHHGQQVPEGHVDIPGGAGAQAHGGGLQQGAVIIRFLGSGQVRVRRWQREEGSQHPQIGAAGAGRRLGCRTEVQLSLVSPALWGDPGSQGLSGVVLGTLTLLGSHWGHPTHRGPSGDTPGTRPLQGSLWGHPGH